MKRRDFIKTSLGVAVTTALTAKPLTSALAASPIKVGILIPLSGPAGLFGPSSQNCAQMAVDEINAAGGILGRPIEPLFADVGGPPADATQAALKLWKGEKAEAFIGMHDSAVRGALTNLFKGQVPYIYTPVYEGGECSPGTYVIGETPEQQLAPVIPWLASEKGASKWYLIGNDYNWPRDTNAAAKGYIEASGGTVVGEEYLPFTADNFDSNLAKIRDTGANAVLITLVGGASVGFNRAFASFGLADKRDPARHADRGEHAWPASARKTPRASTRRPGYFANIDTPAAKAFAEKYAAKFGADAAALNSLGESCYEGVLLLNALAERAKSLSAADMDAIADGTSYDGPRGAATMSDRHVAKDIYLAEADGASFHVVKTFANVDPGKNCG